MMPARPYITGHALERYRRHHPTAEVDDVWAAIGQGNEENPDLVQALTRRTRSCQGSRYISPPDGRGVFVLDSDESTVITYLRFQPSQQWLLRGEINPRVSRKQGPPNSMNTWVPDHIRLSDDPVYIRPRNTPPQTQKQQKISGNITIPALGVPAGLVQIHRAVGMAARDIWKILLRLPERETSHSNLAFRANGKDLVAVHDNGRFLVCCATHERARMSPEERALTGNTWIPILGRQAGQVQATAATLAQVPLRKIWMALIQLPPGPAPDRVVVEGNTFVLDYRVTDVLVRTESDIRKAVVGV